MNRIQFKTILILAIIIGIVAGAILLGKRNPSSPSPEDAIQRSQTKSAEQAERRLNIPILASSALQTLDPIKSAELVQYNLDLQIFEGLVKVGYDGSIQPSLAASWEASEDFHIWTFHLRDAYFADHDVFAKGKGRKITVDDVIYSLKRGLNPAEGSLNSWALSTVVQGADEFATGKSDSVSGLERVNDHTLRVHLAHPDRNFLTRLTVLSTAIVPREAIDRYGSDFGRNPVGSGPFQLVNWQSQEYLELVPNRNYGKGNGKQPSLPKLDRVRFVFFRSESQIANEFQRGALDVRDITGTDLTRAGGIADIQQLEAFAGENKLVRPGSILKLHLLAPLIGEGHVFGTSAELRKQLASTFDHLKLKAAALGPLGVTTKSLMLPSTVLLDSPNRTASDISPANLFPLTSTELTGRTVKVAYVSSRINDVTVRLLTDWLEASGATARLYPSASINALFASVGEINPDLTLIYWSPYYPNVGNYLVALLTSSQPVPNFTGFSNTALDGAVEQLRTVSDASKSELVARIATILDREMPWIPLYFETPLVLTKPWVENFRINPVSVMLLDEVEITFAGRNH